MNNNVHYFIINFIIHNNIFKIYKLIFTFKVLSINTVSWLRRLRSFTSKININNNNILVLWYKYIFL